jgi:hypothetical protein
VATKVPLTSPLPRGERVKNGLGRSYQSTKLTSTATGSLSPVSPTVPQNFPVPHSTGTGPVFQLGPVKQLCCFQLPCKITAATLQFICLLYFLYCMYESLQTYCIETNVIFDGGFTDPIILLIFSFGKYAYSMSVRIQYSHKNC